MKLATLKTEGRDGRLVLVSRDLSRAVDAGDIAPTLLAAVEDWDRAAAELEPRYRALNNGELEEAFPFDPQQAMAPLPRTWQWLDGSLFLSHGERMQKAFNLDPIDGADRIPLAYQGAGDDFIGPHDAIVLPSESHGIDFEGEFAVILDEVPMGCSAQQALSHIRLLVQVNDVSLRALAPREMVTGFGFLQAKPSCSFAPVAVTPDELGNAWQDGRVRLPLRVDWNGEWFGTPNGAEMHFGFHQLIAHCALTRRLSAGTLVGSGTVSNADPAAGAACISERRAVEMVEFGEPRTPFMRFGDRVRMEALTTDGQPLFGAIDQQVKSPGAGQ